MVKINMMCGKRNFGPEWFHIDAAPFPHVYKNDITLNSWSDETIDLLYCSHGIAYFSREELKELLQNWHRVIKPGGTLRLATPDFKILAYLFNAGKCELKEILGPVYGQMKMGTQTIYHKTGYDFNDLEALLSEDGFKDVERYNHWETEHPNTGDRNDFFDDHSAAYINGTLISLNVQCKK